MPRLEIPTPSLLALHAADEQQAVALAAQHFAAAEILALTGGGSHETPHDLHVRIAKRLRERNMVVVCGQLDSTALRQDLVRLAKLENHYAVALIVDESDADREARWRTDGFRRVWTVRDGEELDLAQTPLRSDRRELKGPFDVIGDVHGCRTELDQLLEQLGYRLESGTLGPIARHPEGRTLVFVGDLVDRGPDVVGVLRIAMASVLEGDALCVPGNHEAKLRRHLKTGTVELTHGLAESIEQLDREPPEFLEQVATFIDGLPSHIMLAGGELCISHAGLPERLQGRASRRVRSHCLYGETTGKTDESGFPIRVDWAASQTGGAFVVYGHTPVPEPRHAPHAICIDTGCVFGGSLTALRWPEHDLVQVPAERMHWDPLAH